MPANTDMEALKGGLSGAFKRAASVWGIGRYLYNLDKGWVEIVSKDERRRGRPLFASGVDKRTGAKYAFNWYPPQLPSWALPSGERSQRPVSAISEAAEEGNFEAGPAEEVPATVDSVLVAEVSGLLKSCTPENCRLPISGRCTTKRAAKLPTIIPRVRLCWSRFANL